MFENRNRWSWRTALPSATVLAAWLFACALAVDGAEQTDAKRSFSLKAPNAKEVVLQGQWAKQTLAMTRSDDGTWSVTADAVPAGIWEYSFAVDGLNVIDPSNPVVKPQYQPGKNLLHILSAPPAPWDWQDVPHGTVHAHEYQSGVLGRQRGLLVYTPPGYEADTAKRFPLLVLQHGFGGNQRGWVETGKAHWILDHLIAAGKAVPMVVVMVDGHPLGLVSYKGDPARQREVLEAFRRELLEEAIPLVEKSYRLAEGRENRAIAGLSMGARQSLTVGLNALDRFAWIGAFSGSCDAEAVQPALEAAQDTNARLRLLWIACGRDDRYVEGVKTFVAKLSEQGVRHVCRLVDGDHSWPVWRGCLAEFAPLLFREAEPFRDGDRVCFIGDSITHQMLYHTEITLFYLTRYPDMRVETVNCGFAGDTAAGAVRRYDWDIAARRPTVATVMLGMNDVNRGLYKPGSTGPDAEAKRAAALDSHIKNMGILAERLHRDGVRLILIGPSPYDQTGSQSEENLFGVNDALKTCGAAARRLAEKLQAGWVDFNAPMEAINRDWQARQPGFTLVGPDRIHPGPAGHLVMAYFFLKAQHAPSTVAEVTLDGRRGEVVRHANCDVSDVRVADGTLTFTCRAAALPFPVDKACGPALEWVPFMQELNRERLTVTGLSGERYALEIDGRRVAETTAAALAKGINLAELSDTPQYKQALQIRQWVSERALIEGRKLRTFDHIEFLFLADRANRTPDSDRAYLESKLAELTAKDTVWNRYRAGVIKNYFDLLPEQDALRRRSAELTKSIRENVAPLPRRYAIRLTD